MEITTYQLVAMETHLMEGRETRFKVLHEIKDRLVFYPESGDKEYPGSSCGWRNPYDDDEEGDLNVYRILKEEYHQKYGPLTLKQYINRMKTLLVLFEDSMLLPYKNKRYIRRAWIMMQMYELANNSMGLLLARMKKAVIALYERMVKFKNELAILKKPRQMMKYLSMTLTIMDIVCDKISVFFAENPILLSSLNIESKAYFIQSADPETISTFKTLQQTRWIEPVLIPHVESKYYAYWKDFWSNILRRSLCSAKICLGEDVCDKIAEFIPEKIVGESFIDFFQKHSGKKSCMFDVTHNTHAHFNEIVVILK